MLLGALCGVVGFRLGWRSGRRLTQPLFQSLLGGLAFAASWRARGAIAGALAVGGWAIGTSLISLVVFRAQPERVERQVWRARTYREGMLDWLRTDRGPERRPLATVRAHVLELALFAAAALLTGNVLSIVMASVLLNTMNAYVARLLLAARHAWTVTLLAWNVWSIVRVAAYAMIGSACAGPLASALGYPPRPGEIRLLLWLGGTGIVIDLVLKLSLSRPLGRLLRSAVDLDSAARVPGKDEGASLPEPG